jgi:uncharacterized protein YcbK (DUF882 family)
MYAGGCSALAVIVLMLGSRGLETAVANGDTRTISLHHIHTDEDITITFKRDGRYDEEALKKLNWFVRDWRKEEQIDIDPRLFDLVWEASREVGGDKVIHVVCGYRSPATNAMLRARSSGVAKFSQHTLGKAMDFFIPGASLEELRNVGLRLQRGGVGYYPTSGSPFVHLDVGNVRHWGPPIGDAEMARIMGGHPVHVATAADGAKQDLSKQDLSKQDPSWHRGPSPAALAGSQKKSAPAASHGEDEDEVVAAKPAPVRAAAVPARTNTFALASLDSKPAELGRPVSVAAVPAVPLPHGRPAKTATTMSSDDAGARAPEPAPADRTRLASLAPSAKAVEPATTASTVAWPVRVDNDRVPNDLALAYATPQAMLGATSAMRPEPMGDASRFVPTTAAKSAASHENVAHENVTTVTKNTVVRTASLDPVASRSEPAAGAVEPVKVAAAEFGSNTTVSTKTVVANAGMRYDDPWLRAMIMTPSITDSMTATLYGTPDLTELRNLMRKPNSALMMSFNEDAYPGMAPDRFRGEAVVFLSTRAFIRRTASLR